MSASPEPHAPPVLPSGETCRVCSAALGPDQRYCLGCGTRRGEPRVPFAELLGTPGTPPATPPPAAVGTAPSWLPAGPAGPVVLVLGLLLALGVGALIGHGGRVAPKVIVSKPPVVNVSGGVGGGGGASSTAANAGFTSDWPATRNAFTIRLRTLPASAAASAVDSAKSAASGKGAPRVGALSGADFGLPGGYVIYSGVYKTKKAAQKALGKLKKKFPGAKVIHPQGAGGGGGGGGGGGTASSASHRNAAHQRSKVSGQTYEKQSLKQPNQLGPIGKPPPVDHKAPAGGGPTVGIG